MSISIKIEPKIEPREISFHVDDIRKDSYNQIEETAAFKYPAIKFRNTTIHWSKILRFDLSVGNAFLPKLTVTFLDDTSNLLDTDYPIQDDLITVVLGNVNDTANKPIHSDFKVFSCSVNSSTQSISITAILDIPEWRSSVIRSFGKKSRFEYIKLMCQDLGLGLISNVNSSNDIALHNQYGVSNGTYIENMCKNIFDTDSRFWCFVDANYYLNVIELEKMSSAPEIQEYLNYNLRNGNSLEEEQKIVFTNKHEE